MTGFSIGFTIKKSEVITNENCSDEQRNMYFKGRFAARNLIINIVKHFRTREIELVNGLFKEICIQTEVTENLIPWLMDELIYAEIDTYLNLEKGFESDVILITDYYKNRNLGPLYIDQASVIGAGLANSNGEFMHKVRLILDFTPDHIAVVEKPENRYCVVEGQPPLGEGAYINNVCGRKSLEMKND